MATTPDNTDGKQARGRFSKGQSGNPAGKPKGARNRTTLAVEALMEGDAEAITRKAIEAALAGDMVAIRMVLDRIAPGPKDRAVPFDMPELKAPADAPLIISALLKAVALGDLAPSEAEAVAKLVEFYRRSVETANIEARLKLVEDAHAKA